MSVTRRHVLAAATAATLLPPAAFAANNVLHPHRSAPKAARHPRRLYGGWVLKPLRWRRRVLLSADNRTYVQLVRSLGAQGVIRVGGNVSDFSAYDANGVPKNLPKDTVLTKENFRQLRGFLDRHWLEVDLGPQSGNRQAGQYGRGSPRRGGMRQARS